MPPRKKSAMEKSKKGPKFKYTKEQLTKALESVEGGVLSKSEAARQYNVPKTTLLDKLAGRTPRECKMGHPPYLAKEEEDDIVQWIKDGNRRGLPPTRENVLDTAQRMVLSVPGRSTPFKNGRPGHYWWMGFLTRHPELSIRQPERVSKGRAAVTESSVRAWFNQLARNLNDLDLLDIFEDPKRIFNCDETNIQLAAKTGSVVGLKGQKNCYQVAPGPDKSNLTFVGTFNAAGDIISPTIIYPYKRLPHDILQMIPQDFHYLLTDSGWMTSDSFLTFIVDIFSKWVDENQIKKPVLLFVDGHKTHVTLQVSVKCEENGIVLYLLPPNTTHLLQPADVGPFKPLKTFWAKEVSRKQHLDAENIRRKDVAPMLAKALSKIKKDSIINGFKRTGLYPLDVESVDFSKIVEVNFIEEQNSVEENIDIDDPQPSTSRVTRPNSQYKLVLEIMQEEIGMENLNKNLYERTSMSKDMYAFYKNIREKSIQPNDMGDLNRVLESNEVILETYDIYKPSSNEGPTIVLECDELVPVEANNFETFSPLNIEIKEQSLVSEQNILSNQQSSELNNDNDPLCMEEDTYSNLYTSFTIEPHENPNSSTIEEYHPSHVQDPKPTKMNNVTTKSTVNNMALNVNYVNHSAVENGHSMTVPELEIENAKSSGDTIVSDIYEKSIISQCSSLSSVDAITSGMNDKKPSTVNKITADTNINSSSEVEEYHNLASHVPTISEIQTKTTKSSRDKILVDDIPELSVSKECHSLPALDAKTSEVKNMKIKSTVEHSQAAKNFSDSSVTVECQSLTVHVPVISEAESVTVQSTVETLVTDTTSELSANEECKTSPFKDSITSETDKCASRSTMNKIISDEKNTNSNLAEKCNTLSVHALFSTEVKNATEDSSVDAKTPLNLPALLVTESDVNGKIKENPSADEMVPSCIQNATMIEPEVNTEVKESYGNFKSNECLKVNTDTDRTEATDLHPSIESSSSVVNDTLNLNFQSPSTELNQTHLAEEGKSSINEIESKHEINNLSGNDPLFTICRVDKTQEEKIRWSLLDQILSGQNNNFNQNSPPDKSAKYNTMSVFEGATFVVDELTNIHKTPPKKIPNISSPSPSMSDDTVEYDSDNCDFVALPDCDDYSGPLYKIRDMLKKDTFISDEDNKNSKYYSKVQNPSPSTSGRGLKDTYHKYTSKESIFKNPIVSVKKRKSTKLKSPDCISGKRYRQFVIENKPNKKRKNNDWQCMYCHRLWSEDNKQNKDSKWVECDSCKRQLHVDCSPKFYLEEIGYEHPSDSEDEVDFKCELCHLTD